MYYLIFNVQSLTCTEIFSQSYSESYTYILYEISNSWENWETINRSWPYLSKLVHPLKRVSTFRSSMSVVTSPRSSSDRQAAPNRIHAASFTQTMQPCPINSFPAKRNSSPVFGHSTRSLISILHSIKATKRKDKETRPSFNISSCWSLNRLLLVKL